MVWVRFRARNDLQRRSDMRKVGSGMLKSSVDFSLPLRHYLFTKLFTFFSRVVMMDQHNMDELEDIDNGMLNVLSLSTLDEEMLPA